MKRNLLYVPFIIILLLIPAIAQETLPPYHWVNTYIDYLKVRGHFPQLSVIDRPFNRQTIAKQLLLIDRERLGSSEKKMVIILYREFNREIKYLDHLSGQKWKSLINEVQDLINIPSLIPSHNPIIKTGAFGETSMLHSDEQETDIDVKYHSQIGIYWKDKLTLYNNMFVFNNPDSGYIGKEYGNLFAFTEQGYINLNFKWLQAKLGRDYFQIGPARSSQLLISDNSRTFDMYHIRIGNKVFQFSFWGMQLDRFRSRIGAQAVNANRYLNGHRLSVNINNKIFIGASEVVLYGNVNQNWELGFINPFTFYNGQNINGEPGVPNGNLLYHIDWDIYLFHNWEIYGELLLDDLQFDNKSPSDLEPNEYGFTAGINFANPAGLTGGLFNLEYTQVRNRTYNVQQEPWGKYLHRNKVIGHELGNNFERLASSLTYWAKPNLNVELFGSLIRQGEGSVSGEFNTDYLSFTVEQGYNEKFPFGVVEKHIQGGISAFYKPHSAGHVEVRLAWNDFTNYRHIDGRNFSEFTARATLWLQWNKLWVR